MSKKKQPKINEAHFERKITAIDTHTQGEPTRIILDGFPEPKGDTMLKKMQDVAKNHDHYRSALMDEPRGHKDMFGALLTKPIDPKADFGVIFMEGTGYMPMCGHGSMGAATALVEAGLVEVSEPYTAIILEAPAGLIEARVAVEEGKAKEVSIINVPSFLYKEKQTIEIDDHLFQYDLVFGGNFMALVEASQLGLQVSSSDLAELTAIGIKLLEKINRDIDIQHPNLDITEVVTCEFYETIDTDELKNRNVVVFGDYQVDRSPCGAGTSAMMAAMYARGKLTLHESFINESIIGSRFVGELLEEKRVGSYRAVVPKITGSAYITSQATYFIDPEDALRYGFHLK